MEKNIFKKIIHFRLISVLFILVLVSIILTTILYTFQLFPYGAMMGTIAALLSALIALFLPFIIKVVDKNEETEKIIRLREQGYQAFEELCDFYLEQFDSATNLPKQNIEVEDRTKMISQIQTIYTYKDNLFSMGIIISSGWQKVEGSHKIYIHTTPELDFKISAHDFGKIRKIELRYRGQVVKKKSEILEPLEKIRKQISFIDVYTTE